MAFLSPAINLASRSFSLFSGKAYSRRFYSGQSLVLSSVIDGTDIRDSLELIQTKIIAIGNELAIIEEQQKNITIKEAKRICPVLTGALRNSLKITGEDPYNIDVEFDGLFAIIIVNYNLYKFTIESELPYWPIENNKNKINDIAIEKGISYVQKKLINIVSLGASNSTRVIVRSS